MCMLSQLCMYPMHTTCTTKEVKTCPIKVSQQSGDKRGAPNPADEQQGPCTTMMTVMTLSQQCTEAGSRLTASLTDYRSMRHEHCHCVAGKLPSPLPAPRNRERGGAEDNLMQRQQSINTWKRIIVCLREQTRFCTNHAQLWSRRGGGAISSKQLVFPPPHPSLPGSVSKTLQHQL